MVQEFPTVSLDFTLLSKSSNLLALVQWGESTVQCSYWGLATDMAILFLKQDLDWLDIIILKASSVIK